MNVEQARFNMIEQQIPPWDVLDQGVLSLLAEMRREDFVPAAHRALAFVDMQIPLKDGADAIAHGHCMLEPKVEARLLQELQVQRSDRVLEVGAGSGYMAALLAHKAQQVTTLEIDPALAKLAGDNLRRAAVTNATVREADGSAGWSADGPYDVIVLSGSVPEVPSTILDQLKLGGRLATVVGHDPVMRAVIMTRVGEREFRRQELFDTLTPRLAGFPEPTRFRF